MIHRTYPDGQRPRTARRDQPVSTAPVRNAPGDALLSLQRVLLNVHGGHHFSDARVRRHERRNALHTLRGLIQLARHATERPELAAEWPGIPLTAISELIARVQDPLVRAHLVGKMLATTERGVRLGISPRSQLPDRPDLAGALITVLGNLVDNAMDAVLDGRGNDPWIEVSLRQEPLLDSRFGGAGAVELAVADNGPGVAVELRNRIFTRGFSTKPVSSDQRRGLGLALVKSIAEEHGGSVAVADRPGGGGLFTVRIPTPRPTATPGRPAGSGRRDGEAR
ncbi:sensor histidine kinase [Streptomyces sp. NPDC001568]|uniref:sensor histidine kinase n=1 Tax=Streptomyces sp. NPDC001568 TaxID=3364588 RepID=UPI0036BB6699